MSDQLMQTSIMLVGVVVLIFILSFIFKRLPLSRKFVNNPIKIINIQNISSKDKLILIDIENERLLLSLSSNGIQKIHSFKENQVLNENQLKHPSYLEKVMQ